MSADADRALAAIAAMRETVRDRRGSWPNGCPPDDIDAGLTMAQANVLADVAEAAARLVADVPDPYIVFDSDDESWRCLCCGDSRPGHDPSCLILALRAALARLAEVAG